MILTRKEYENREAQFLAPYAVRSAESRGRAHPEKEHEYRTAFQRDRDRVIHSTAFRRLQYKTQVFVNSEGDHYRTRLTHTIETAQIARTIGRSLGLNEDLIEAIALAHDLGHGPFGHAGEWALEALMKNYGGFEHNLQGLRIVEQLEEVYSQFPGLNLTFEVREGMKKHQKDAFLSLEARVVDLSDEIAYDSHDLDDGIRSGYLSESELQKLFIWKKISHYLGTKTNLKNDPSWRRAAIRLLINHQVNDLLKAADRNLRKLKSSKKLSSDAIIRAVHFSIPTRKWKKELKSFLHENLYSHYRVVRMTDKGQRIIRQLFQIYLDKPKQLSPGIRRRIGRDTLERVICDYVAGMTDRFAQDEYKRLFDPDERV